MKNESQQNITGNSKQKIQHTVYPKLVHLMVLLLKT